MNYWWHQFEPFLRWGGTLEGAIFIAAMGGLGGLITGAILLAVEGVRAFVRGFKGGRAEIRAKRVAKQRLPPDDSHPAPPTSDVPFTSDI